MDGSQNNPRRARDLTFYQKLITMNGVCCVQSNMDSQFITKHTCLMHGVKDIRPPSALSQTNYCQRRLQSCK